MRKIFSVIMALMFSVEMFGQRSVSGWVFGDDGVALPGANVSHGRGNGTITDREGHFSLIVSDENSPLTFSFIGYSPYECGLGALRGNDTIYLEADVLQMAQVVVTGTRTPRMIKDVPVQTRLISGSDIAKVDATNVEDLLQQEMPGVEFTYAKSQQVNMNLSGFAGQSVLFLVDGERMAGENVENIDFNRLDMSNVRQIEIVKGAASALYGSQANGGVINIITREPQEPFAIDANYRMAAHGENREGIKVILSNKKISNVLTANRYHIDNYDVDNGDGAQGLVFSTIYGNTNINIKDRITLSCGDRVSVVARASYFRRETERTMGAPERFYDFAGGVRLRARVSDNDDLELSYSFDEYDKSDYSELSGFNIRDYSNVQNIVRALYNHTLDNGSVITAGGDFMNDYLMNYYFADGAHEQRSVDGFLQYDWRISPRWEMVTALRYDYFGEQGVSRATPKVSVCCKPRPGWALRGSYGMGFRAPTLKEMYTDFDIQGMWYLRGNMDLRPETSHNWNLSAEYSRARYCLGAMAYFNDVSHRIATSNPAYDADNLRYIQYINLDGLKVWGGELQARRNWDCGFAAQVSYVYTHEQQQTESMSQYTPPREHSVCTRADYTRKFGKNYSLYLSLSGRLMSKVDSQEYVDMLDETKGTTICHCPAYTIWKFQANQKICGRFSVNLAVDNIFNYRPRYYYSNAPITTGANFMVGVCWRMGEE